MRIGGCAGAAENLFVLGFNSEPSQLLHVGVDSAGRVIGEQRPVDPVLDEYVKETVQAGHRIVEFPQHAIAVDQ